MLKHIIFAPITITILIMLAKTAIKEGLGAQQQWPGRNNTVLFLTDSHRGCANVLLATSQALSNDYPDLEIHFASFPKLADDVATISRTVSQNPNHISPITFHSLSGPPRKHSPEQLLQNPGVSGMKRLCNNIMDIMIPWTGDEYFALFNEVVDILRQVDPLIVAIDPMFGPGIDAVDAQKYNRVIISPNTLKDTVAVLQPWGRGFWKYPAMGSGYAYPVPWHLIPSNIYINIRFIYSIAFTVPRSKKVAYLKSLGIVKPFFAPNIFHEKYVHLCAGFLEYDFPLTVVPKHIVPCGPILLFTSPAEEQDLELTEWTKKMPTILINLGSIYTYTEQGAKEMASAISTFLNFNSNNKKDFQVLWKFSKRTDFSDDFLVVLEKQLSRNQVRIEQWLSVDPAALMEAGYIACSVHHGGASSYHEAIGNGIVQVILPVWADTYDFATRAEYLGVGIWGSPNSAPEWTAVDLVDAFTKVLGDDECAMRMRDKARELGEVNKRNPGRVTAAFELARLARRV